jgi:hypothetical protein
VYCPNCEAALPEDAVFCPNCGADFRQTAQPALAEANLRGFSAKINDPAFAGYISKTNRWSAIVSLIMAVAAVVGFYIAGETSSEFKNPGALYIGFGLAAMFLLIAFFQIVGRNRSQTWDGVVLDKKIKKKTARQDYGDDAVHYDEYLEYQVIIRSDKGKRHLLKAHNSDCLYNYYQVGDRVRHHAGLNSYEKYDKTGDKCIPCSACGTMCEIHDEICFRCKCPLLK